MSSNHDWSTTTARSETSDGGKTAQTLALVVGAVFLVVGVLGFVPGVTTDYDTMQFAGHESEAKLLGVFQVSILHNIVHLLFGVAGVALGRKAPHAVAYLVGGGAVYLLLTVYGWIIDKDSGANFVPLNTADDWLHLGLGVGMVAMGVMGKKAYDDTRTRR